MSEKHEVFDVNQGHGNHLESVTYDNEPDRMIGLLPEMFPKAELLFDPVQQLPCSLGGDYPDRLTCLMLADTKAPLHMNMLIGCSINDTHHELLSFYPELTGAEVEVELTAIH